MINEGTDGSVIDNDSTSSGRFGGAAWVVRSGYQIKSATGNSGAFDQNNPDIRFSREQGQGGMLAADVEATIAPIVAKWKYGNIQVVQSVADLPASLQQEIYSASAEGDMEGVYLPGSKTVYLVADHLPNEQRVREVLAHEVIGHLAADELTDQADYKRAISSVKMLDRAGNKTIRALGQTVDERQPGLSASNRAKEIMALAVENGSYKNIPVLQKAVTAIVSWVKNKLRAMGFDWKWINRMSEGEVFALLRQGERRLYRAASDKQNQFDGQTVTGDDKALARLSREQDGSPMNKANTQGVTYDHGHKILATSPNFAQTGRITK